MINFAPVRQSLTIAAATTVALVAAAGALIATPAAAEVSATTTQTTVSFADLDLSTPGGQARMHTRMRAAARQVCDYDPAERDLGLTTQRNACVVKAMKGAEVELAAVTSTRSGQRVAVRDAGQVLHGRAR